MGGVFRGTNFKPTSGSCTQRYQYPVPARSFSPPRSFLSQTMWDLYLNPQAFMTSPACMSIGTVAHSHSTQSGAAKGRDVERLDLL